MKILIIQGSPHKEGSSNILAEQFKAGAEKAGHEVVMFDAAHAKIAPCIACEYCHTRGDGVCCQQDDMETLKQMILSSDMVVLATPLYFFNMSAQMKLAVDRLYAFLGAMSRRIKQMALIVAANNPNPHIMDCVVTNYLSIVNFLGVQNVGMILGAGCGTPEITKTTVYPRQAFELGASLSGGERK